MSPYDSANTHTATKSPKSPDHDRLRSMSRIPPTVWSILYQRERGEDPIYYINGDKESDPQPRPDRSPASTLSSHPRQPASASTFSRLPITNINTTLRPRARCRAARVPGTTPTISYTGTPTPRYPAVILFGPCKAYYLVLTSISAYSHDPRFDDNSFRR